MFLGDIIFRKIELLRDLWCGTTLIKKDTDATLSSDT